MENREIEEGNKLIAEFMASRVYSNTFHTYYVLNGEDVKEEWLKYHSSWDWLMSVVEKIESYAFADHSKPLSWTDTPYLRTFLSSVGVRINRYPLHKEETKILSTWVAVVEFIKDFNEHKSAFVLNPSLLK